MDVLELLSKNEEELRSRCHVKKIGVFGSIASNEASAVSDVDIFVEFEQPVIDAVVRNFEIIGEAASHVPRDIKTRHL